jgi:polysaccharide deacetylase family protein (PEP-CTERM system associated)
MINALSIDLEEWFCGHILEKGLSRSYWNSQELRVIANTKKLLRILDDHNTKATFFVLGWLAERAPDLVKEVARRGHEIATHGYSHVSLTEMTPKEFEDDLKKALTITQECVDYKILGYRAPSFTVTKKTSWAFDIMAKHGIKYDSSVFPIGFHPDYGVGDSQLSVYKITNAITEVPLSVVEMVGKRIPCGGGGYFRLYPYGLTKALLSRCTEEGRPIVFYLHPWELDMRQPRIGLSFLNRFRHYHNLDKVHYRLEKLLYDFKFATIRKVLGI